MSKQQNYNKITYDVSNKIKIYIMTNDIYNLSTILKTHLMNQQTLNEMIDLTIKKSNMYLFNYLIALYKDTKLINDRFWNNVLSSMARHNNYTFIDTVKYYVIDKKHLNTKKENEKNNTVQKDSLLKKIIDKIRKYVIALLELILKKIKSAG